MGSFWCDRFSGLSPFSILHSPFSILRASLALSLASMMTTEEGMMPGSPACGALAARHGRHARSHSHHVHREATVTPQSLQAAGKLLCATTLSSLDAAVVTQRRRRVTSFAFPSGGAPIGASRHLRLALCSDAARAEHAECIYGSECEDCVPHVCRPPPPMAICIKDCMIGMPSYASDGDGDGGGPGAQELVTGCAECGTRFPPPPPICAETLRTTQGVSQVVQLGFRRRLRPCDDGGPGSRLLGCVCTWSCTCQ
jgi:hypothetical protein